MGTTAYQWKGSKGRAVSGDRLIGAAGCGSKHIMASCETPLSPQ